jgi:YD repeat-containing protein
VAALQNLGALVIGLGAQPAGTDPATTDPGELFQALAEATGAVNYSSGQPLYFNITSPQSMVNSMTEAAMDVLFETQYPASVKLVAQDPTFIGATPTVIQNVQAGDTTTFNISITGDANGAAHNFNLQFRRADTGIQLGSIPVTINSDYVYQVQAVSPDGDPLTYHLVDAPAGAAISEGGEIRWQPPAVGSYHFLVEVDDNHGGSAQQAFNVKVTELAPDHPPTFDGVVGSDGVQSLPDATVGKPYSYTLQATDPDGDPLSYYNMDVNSPVPIDAQSGTINWTPNENNVGTNLFTVQVCDGRGGTDTREFSITVDPASGPSVYAPPQFTSAPLETAVVGQDYLYHVQAIDPDGNYLFYQFLSGPEGMVMDYRSDAIAWQPTEADVGQEFPVEVSVTDGQTTMSQAFLVTVCNANDPPVIETTSLPQAQARQPYQYPIQATDPNDDVLSYALDASSIAQGMRIDSDSGLFYWTPSAGGEYPITVTVSDDRGGVTAATFLLDVLPSTAPTPIYITSSPPVYAAVGSAYEYDLSIDLNTPSVRYVLDDSSKALGMTVGVDPQTHQPALQWTPTMVGDFPVTLTATLNGASAVQNFEIHVLPADSPPQFLSTPGGPAARNLPYQYRIDVQDPEGEPITLSYTTPDNLPASENVSISGNVFSWTPTVSGVFQFGITATDTSDYTATQTFQLLVLPDAPPEITSSPVAAAPSGRSYQYQVTAQDPNPDDNTPANPLTYSLQAVPLGDSPIPVGLTIDPHTGLVSWATQTDPSTGQVTGGPAIGTYAVSITVTDGEGAAATQTYNLLVYDSSQPSSPTVSVSMPDLIPAGQLFEYQVYGQSPIDDPLSYQLVPPDGGSLPAGLIIGPASGLITWTPTDDQINDPANPYSFYVKVTDTRTGVSAESDLISLNVVSSASLSPPEIQSNPITDAVAGLPYLYQATATDPNGGSISWALAAGAPAGMSVDFRTGYVSWTPAESDVGSYPLELLATDSFGLSATQDFTLTVQSAGQPPTIVSTFDTKAIAGQAYQSQIVASDPEGYRLRFTLGDGSQNPPYLSDDMQQLIADGLTLSPDGLLTWANPQKPDSGTYLYMYIVTYTVTDQYGYATVESDGLNICPAEEPPKILNDPAQWFVVRGSTYEYDIQTTSGGASSLTFALAPVSGQTSLPDGANMGFEVTDSSGNFPDTPSDSAPGVLPGRLVRLVWTNTLEVPTTGDNGQQFWYEVQVSNDAYTAIKDVPVVFVPNDPPSFTVPTGQVAAAVGQTLEIDANPSSNDVIMPDGSSFTSLPLSCGIWRLDPNDASNTLPLPQGMSIDPDGHIFWTPTAAEASNQPYTFDVVVSDRWGRYTIKPFTVSVGVPPQVSLTLSKSVAAPGDTVTATVTATDEDQISSVNLSVNGQPVTLTSDGGSEYSYAYTVPANAADGTLVKFIATATDNDGFQAATPAAIVDVESGDQPVAIITTPDEGAVVTAPVDVLGIAAAAQGQQFGSYSLSITPLDNGNVAVPASFIGPMPNGQPGTTGSSSSGDYTVLASGTSAVVNCSLGQLDPTLLADGTYQLRLVVADAAGHSTTYLRTVQVSGNLKLGNFSLSFQDLQVPMPGTPITVTRVYDSTRDATQGDFGYGWRLATDVTSLSLQPVGDPTSAVADGPTFRDGSRVVVTLPDGTTEGFTFHGVPYSDNSWNLGISNTYVPYYQPDDGVSDALFVKNVVLSSVDGSDDTEYYVQLDSDDGDDYGSSDASDAITYNPTDPYFGNVFYLQEHNGQVLALNATTGQVESTTDRNGNTISYQMAGGELVGITEAGRSVRFQRDYAGRIITVIGPTDTPNDVTNDPAIGYDYDAQGDLVSVTRYPTYADREAALAGETTQYQYDATNYPHYLTGIIDAEGVQVMQVTLGPDGRIQQVSDAAGDSSGFSYKLDLGDGRFVESSQSGDQATQEVLDSSGNVLRNIQQVGDGQYLVTAYTYDQWGHQTAESVPFTVDDSNPDPQSDSSSNWATDPASPYNAPPATWKTTSYYDASGDLLATSDALGDTTSYIYDQYGNVVSTTDPLGNVTTNQYDSSGNLVSTTDALGNVTATYTYDPAHPGQVQSVSDGAGNLLSSFTYDAYGDVLTSTSAEGVVTHYQYNAEGQPTRTWYDTTDAAGNPVEMDSYTSYDMDGNAVATSQVEVTDPGQSDAQTETLSSTSTQYNAAGKVTESIDANGLETENKYDSRGLLIETYTQSPNAAGDLAWLVTRTVYDDQGRAIYTTDQYPYGATNTDGTYTVYDSAGRVVETERLKNFFIDILNDPGPGDPSSNDSSAPLESSVSSPGTLVSSTSTVYNHAGQVASTFDQYGTETDYIYDAAGRQIETRTQSKDSGGNLVWLATRTVYDADGRPVVTSDQYQENADGSMPPTDCTETIYDADGRAVQTERLEGAVIDLVSATGGSGPPGATGGSSASGLRSELTNSGTVVWTTETTYNTQGQTIESVGQHAPGAAGPVTDYEYDAQGRQTAEIGPAVLDPLTGQLVRDRTETTYDSQGRVASTTDGIRVVVNSSGDVLSTDPSAETTSYEYDALGNKVRTTYADGSFTTAAYDAQGNQVATTDQAASGTPAQDLLTTTYQYDSAGRLATVTLPAVPDPQNGGQLTSPIYAYAYDAFGNQVSTTDPLGRQTLFTYDTQGHELTHTLPLGVASGGLSQFSSDENGTVPLSAVPFTEQMQYNDLGQETLDVSFEGVVTAYQYDNTAGGEGRLVEKDFFDSLDAYNAWLADPQDNHPAESTDYTYDAFGRQTEILQADASGDVRETDNTYDAQGNLVAVATPEGTAHYVYDPVTGLHTATWTGSDQESDSTTDTQYAYDALGRLTQVTQDRRNGQAITPESTDYVYDLLGNLKQERLPNGVVEDYTYDRLNRLTQLREYQDANHDAVFESGTDQLLAEYDYTLLPDGKRSHVDEQVFDGQTIEVDHVDWFYDALGRLTAESYQSSDPSLSYIDQYTYDLVGNRLQESIAHSPSTTAFQTFLQAGTFTPDETITSTFDANDRLLTEADNNGLGGTQCRFQFGLLCSL